MIDMLLTARTTSEFLSNETVSGAATRAVHA